MGNKVRTFRLRRKLTQEELAKRSGLSRQTISTIENGDAARATGKTLLAIAKALNTTCENLFFNQGD